MNIGVDFGGSAVKFGIFKDNELIKFSQYLVNANETEILCKFKENLDDMLDDMNLSYDDFSGIGIALAGVVEQGPRGEAGGRGIMVGI